MNKSSSTFWRRLSDRTKLPRRLWYPPAPVDIYDQDLWQKQFDDVCSTIRRSMFGLLGYAAFCLIALGQPDAELLRENAVQLPIVNTKVSIAGFMIIGPLVLIGLSAYLHIFIGRWVIMISGKTMDSLSPPYIFNLPVKSAALVSAFLFYWLPPFVLAAFVFKGQPYTDFDYQILWVSLIVTLMFLLLAIRRCPDARRKFQNPVLWLVSLVVFVGIASDPLDGNERQLNLYRADLSDVSLHNADLRDVDLTDVNLTGTNLTDADLSLANLSNADLSRAVLIRADLTEAFLSDSDLTFADLTDAVLINAFLTDADLINADLSRANLTGADLIRADLTGANLTDTVLINAVLTDVNLTDADLAGADLTDAYMVGAYLTGANLTGADLTDSDLTFAYMTGAVLTYADLTGAYMSGADLRDVDLTFAYMTGAVLTDADLSNADLSRAVLIRADLTDADLTDADLTGANLTDADLSGAILNCNQLAAARKWKSAFRDTVLGCGEPIPEPPAENEGYE